MPEVNDIVENKLVFEGRFVKLFHQQIVLPNKKIAYREVVEGKDAVTVIAVTENKELILVKQFRPAIKREIVELPAGLIEYNEEPLNAAVRELEEETGYTCGKIEKIMEFFTSPGFSSSKMHLYYASQLKKSKQNLDEDEFLDVMKVKICDLDKLEIVDAKTIIGIMHLKLIL